MFGPLRMYLLGDELDGKPNKTRQYEEVVQHAQNRDEVWNQVQGAQGVCKGHTCYDRWQPSCTTVFGLGEIAARGNGDQSSKSAASTFGRGRSEIHPLQP